MKKLLLFISILFFTPFVFALSYENGQYVTSDNEMQVWSYTDQRLYIISPGNNVTAHNITRVSFILEHNIKNGRYYQLEVNLSRSTFNSDRYKVEVTTNGCELDGVESLNTSYPKFNFHCSSDQQVVVIEVYDEYDLATLITTEGTFYYNYAFLRYATDYTEQINEGVSDINDKLDEVNDNLTDDNVNNNVISNFFSNFQNNDHGLSSIITAPLSAIQSMSSATCSPLVIPIPFTNRNVTIPCMSSYYNTYIPQIYSLWQTITFGIVSYFICVDVYKMVKGFKDPESDKVEVMDL